jgi:hypothetical protein
MALFSIGCVWICQILPELSGSQLAADGETDTLGGTGNESGFIDEF